MHPCRSHIQTTQWLTWALWSGRSISEPHGWGSTRVNESSFQPLAPVSEFGGEEDCGSPSLHVLAKPADQLGGQAPAMALRNWARRGSVAASNKLVDHGAPCLASAKTVSSIVRRISLYRASFFLVSVRPWLGLMWWLGQAAPLQNRTGGVAAAAPTSYPPMFWPSLRSSWAGKHPRWPSATGPGEARSPPSRGAPLRSPRPADRSLSAGTRR